MTKRAMPPPAGTWYPDRVVALNGLAMTRAVEKTAVLLSLFMGAATEPRPQVGTYRGLAVNALAGELTRVPCRGRLIHRDPSTRRGHNPSREELLWDQLTQDAGHFGSPPVDSDPTSPSDPWRLEVVASALDGSRDLKEGYDSGSVSVLAAGPPGTFIGEDTEFGRVRHFLVITARRQLNVDSFGTNFIETGDPSVTANTKRVKAETFLADILEVFVRRLEQLEQRFWTSATLSQQATMRHLKGELDKKSHVRVFHGSSVAAALTPYFPAMGVDTFTGVVRRTQVVQIAAAAHASGGRFLAIPLVSKCGDDDLAGEGPFTISPGSTVYYKEHIVQSGHETTGTLPRSGVVIVTGVNENLLVHGVRTVESRLATHTLLMELQNQASSFIERRFRLETGFELLSHDGELAKYTDPIRKRYGVALTFRYPKRGPGRPPKNP